MAKKKTMKTLYLPSELIIEILLRLPVKSLIRFKCVRKSWVSLISQPNFANSHFQITSASRILSISHTSLSKFESIDFEINHDSVLLHHTFLLSQPHSYVEIKGSCRYFEIKGSCRGLICLKLSGKTIYIWVWNPSNGFHKQIPLAPFGYKSHRLYGFGYDPSRDDYVVVLLSYDLFSSRLEFFSLRDNTWNKIRGPHITYLNAPDFSKVGSFINGVVHWLARRYGSSMDVIVAYDLMERKLFEMPLPDNFHPDHEMIDLWVFGEFLSLWVKDYYNYTFEVWVMKEYKQHSSWTKTIVIHADRIPFIKPLCSTKCGDIIGKDGDRLVKYNDKGQLLEYLHIDRDARELAMYKESLFSLPGELCASLRR